MNSLPKIAFIIEEFTVPSAGQQLLDRFLIGYNVEGTFRTTGAQVILAAPRNAAVEARVKEFGLSVADNVAKAVGESGAAVVVPKGDGTAPNPALIRATLQALPAKARCFVYGLLAAEQKTAEELRNLARERGIALHTGSATATAFRLPEIVVDGQAVQRALAVCFGPSAEFDALEMFRATFGARLDQRVASLRRLHGTELWRFAHSSDWRGLLASAVSRSNTIQGDPEKDGRTQDVFGLQLLEKLAANPRAWIIEFADGLNAAIFDLTGALQDLNLAVAMNTGVASAQFYRPPLPMQDHFSPLAEQVERFFRVDEPPVSHGLVASPFLLEKMRA